jgi:hypothetical protein
MLIRSGHKDYNQIYNQAKIFLRRLGKLLKGTKQTSPAIRQIIITQHNNGEISMRVFTK